METSATQKFDPIPQSEKDRRMKLWVLRGDSRRLPVSIRHRDHLYELVYRKHDALMLAYSGAWDKKPKNGNREYWDREVRAHKDKTRKTMSEWLERNDIPRNRVEVVGIQRSEDYRIRFVVMATVTRPVSLFVPPFGDEWWEEMRRSSEV